MDRTFQPALPSIPRGPRRPGNQTDQKARLMNAQFRTPGANKRTNGGKGRGLLWGGLFVVFAIALVIAALVLL